MLRVISFALLVSGFLSLTAYRLGAPGCSEQALPVNSTVAGLGMPAELQPAFLTWTEDGEIEPVGKHMRILMLNYTAYDSAYVDKVRHLIGNRLRGATITDFWEGSAEDLAEALHDQHVVVVTYPATGSKSQVRAYGKVLVQFVQQGGAVVFSGTNQFGVLQQFGLIDVDFGYFCSDLEVHETAPGHPVLKGTPRQFSMTNYAYPLDISDPNFVTLADIHDCPTMGYKAIGKGKVVYLGLEYYFDEAVSTQILENTLLWLVPPEKVTPSIVVAAPAPVEDRWTARVVKRSEEFLYTGSGSAPKPPTIDLKIYPNPFTEKAWLDIDILKTAVVMVDLTDESGTLVATPFNRRTVSAGLLHIDLPDVAPGVYFVKCQVDGQSMVKKVVKVAVQ